MINPATEERIASVSLGSEADVDRAVVAARTAFESYSRWSKAERIELFEAIIAAY